MNPPRRLAASLPLALLALTAAPGCQTAPGTPPSVARIANPTTPFVADTAAPGGLTFSAPGEPMRVRYVPAASSGRFIAALNGQDVTARFLRTGDGYVFAGHRFPADAGQTPQRIDFWTGHAAGPASQSATFVPAALAVRGNRGDDHQSRVVLPESGETQLQLTLPQRIDQPVTVTLTPAPQAGDAPIALAGAAAGRPARVTFPAGSRVALVAARATAPGRTSIAVSAPGYAAATLPVQVHAPMPELYGVGADLRKVVQNPTADDAAVAEVPSE